MNERPPNALHLTADPVTDFSGAGFWLAVAAVRQWLSRSTGDEALFDELEQLALARYGVAQIQPRKLLNEPAVSPRGRFPEELRRSRRPRVNTNGLPAAWFVTKLPVMNYRISLSLLVAATAIAANGFAEPTAFDLIKEGNKHVGEEARDKVVEIHSDRSVGDLTPSVWYIVYYDPDATAKAVEVKFAAGKKVSVKRPARVLEFVTGNRALERSKFKIDSDRALKIARDEPLLKKVDLKASQMWLRRHDEHAAVWKIRLWAAKLNKPGNLADVGEVYLDAETGKVFKSDVHIDRVQ